MTEQPEQNAQPQPEPAVKETQQAPAIPPVQYQAPPAETYYLPTITDDTTPAEAEQAIDAIMAEVGADAKHPYSNSHHFQHKKWVTVFTKLHEIKAKAGDGLSPTTRACNEAMAGLAAKQDANYDRGVKIQDELIEKHGYTKTTIPKDVPVHRVESWQQQLLIENGDFDGLGRALEKDMQTIRTPDVIRQAFQAVIGHDSTSPERRKELAEMVVRWVYEDKDYTVPKKKE